MEEGRETEGKAPSPQNPAGNEPVIAEKQPAELQAIPPEEERRRLGVVLRARSEFFQGPFPHPKHAEKYEELCPGFLQRSLTMAESAQATNVENSHIQLQNERLALENERQKIAAQQQYDALDSRDTARAQYLGFAALIILAFLAVFLACFNHEKIAVALFGAAGLGFIGKIFVSKFYSAAQKAE